MSSSINPSNIDGAFPVAGQDNSSQGFRDNFTNTKNNFTFAKSEIEALQLSKASLTGTNDYSGNIIKNAEFQDNSKTVFAKGTTSGTITFDHTQGHIQTLTTSGNVTFSFTNFPANLKHGSILVVLTLSNVDHIVTLPGSVTLPSGFVTSVDGVGTYWYEFVSNDGGTTYTLFDRNRSYGPNTGNLDISTNIISTTTTNTDIIISPNGTGNIELQKDTNITGSLVASGSITGDSLIAGDITITGNNITSNSTNANIQLDPAGTGDIEFRTVEQLSVGAGGTATTPPDPLGYVQINVNGRRVVVPFYNAS